MIWANADSVIALVADGDRRISGVEESSRPPSAVGFFHLFFSLALIAHANSRAFGLALLSTSSPAFLAIPFFGGILVQCLLIQPVLLRRGPLAGVAAAAALNLAGSVVCRMLPFGGRVTLAAQFLVGMAAVSALQSYERHCIMLKGCLRRFLGFDCAVLGVLLGLGLPSYLRAINPGEAGLRTYLDLNAIIAAVLMVLALLGWLLGFRERAAPAPYSEEGFFGPALFYTKFCLSFAFFRRLLLISAIAAASLVLLISSLPAFAHTLSFSPLFGCLAGGLLLICGSAAVAAYALIYAKYRRQSALLGMMTALSAFTSSAAALCAVNELRPLFLLTMALHGCTLLPLSAMTGFLMTQKVISVPRHIIFNAICVCASTVAIVLLAASMLLRLAERGAALLLFESALMLLSALLTRGIDVETMP